MAKKSTTKKKMPSIATETKQGAAITTGELPLTVKGKKKAVKVYVITVKGTKLYAVRRALAPVDNAKYLPMKEFEAARNVTKSRKAKEKKAAAPVELSAEARAMVPAIAKLQRGEIKLLAAEALKYKKVNAAQIKNQVKADKLKAKIDGLQKQIDALETGSDQ